MSNKERLKMRCTISVRQMESLQLALEEKAQQEYANFHSQRAYTAGVRDVCNIIEQKYGKGRISANV